MHDLDPSHDGQYTYHKHLRVDDLSVDRMDDLSIDRGLSFDMAPQEGHVFFSSSYKELYTIFSLSTSWAGEATARAVDWVCPAQFCGVGCVSLTRC